MGWILSFSKKITLKNNRNNSCVERSKSILKLIVVNKNFEECFCWGQGRGFYREMFYHLKVKSIDDPIIQEEMHRWYANDRTIAIQNEILNKTAEVIYLS
jgi:hypothetical protein